MLQRISRTPARLVDETGGEPFGIVEQHFEQVFGRELRIAFTHRQCLRALDESPRALRIFLDVHPSLLSARRPVATTRVTNSAPIGGRPLQIW